jgi:hypothetical protein
VWIEAHLGSHQVSRVIYGAIIGLAVVVGLEKHPPRPVEVVATLVATALAVGLAELYSETVGTETRTRRRIERAELRPLLADVGAVVFGIAFPAAFFVLAALGAMESATAFTVAKWTGLGLIGCYGFAAGMLAGARLPVALLQAFAVGAIGGVLIALNTLVH